jgi:hypothetical protein
MSRSIPIRDLYGKIVGMKDDKEVDPVQATIDASMKAVGAQTTQPQQPDVPRPSRAQMVLGAVVAVVVVVSRTGEHVPKSPI